MLETPILVLFCIGDGFLPTVLFARSTGYCSVQILPAIGLLLSLEPTEEGYSPVPLQRRKYATLFQRAQ